MLSQAIGFEQSHSNEKERGKNDAKRFKAHGSVSRHIAGVNLENWQVWTTNYKFTVAKQFLGAKYD